MDYKKFNEEQTVSERDSFTMRRYKQFAKYLKESGQYKIILDVGCNTGRGGNVLIENFPQSELIGLDIVPERLAKVPKGVFVRLICGTSTDRHFEDNSISAIVGGEFIEHLESNDVDISLRLFYKYLMPGGLLLLTTPNPQAYLEKLGRTSVFSDPSHFCIMSIQDLTNRLKQSGFKKIIVKGSGKASIYLPDWFPLINVFGSYLIMAKKD